MVIIAIFSTGCTQNSNQNNENKIKESILGEGIKQNISSELNKIKKNIIKPSQVFDDSSLINTEFDYGVLIDPMFIYDELSGSEKYGFYYLPKIQEQEILNNKNNTNNGFSVGGPWQNNQISFSIYELLSGEIKPYIDNNSWKIKQLLLNAEINKKNKYFKYTELENLILKQKLVRNLKPIVNRKIFTEELEDGTFRCLYFIERINSNYVVFYSGCGKKEKFNIKSISLLKKDDLRAKLSQLETKRLNEIQKEAKYSIYYYVFQNSIRSYNPKNQQEEILSTPYNSFELRLNCEQKGNTPILVCCFDFYESYGEPYILFFTNTNKLEYLENCKTDNKSDIEIIDQQVVIKCNKTLNTSSKNQKLYDFNGVLLE